MTFALTARPAVHCVVDTKEPPTHSGLATSNSYPGLEGVPSLERLASGNE